MFDFVKWLHDFFRDKATKWSSKLFFLLLILVSLLIIDDYFGWSYYSNAKNKISLITDINVALKDTSLNDSDISFLNEKKLEIIKRQTIFGKTRDFILAPFNNSNSDQNYFKTAIHEIIYGHNIIPQYRSIVLNFPVFIVFITMTIIVFCRRLSRSKKRSIFFTNLLISIVAIIVNVLSYNWIPLISRERIWINYIVYFVLGIITALFALRDMIRDTDFFSE